MHKVLVPFSISYRVMFKFFSKILSASPKYNQILFPNIVGGDFEVSCASAMCEFLEEKGKNNYEEKSKKMHGIKSKMKNNLK